MYNIKKKYLPVEELFPRERSLLTGFCESRQKAAEAFHVYDDVFHQLFGDCIHYTGSAQEKE